MKEIDRKIQLQICKIGKLCKERRLTLVTAESCTGGGLAYFITSEPECSVILERGYVVYSNQAKESLLKVGSDALLSALENLFSQPSLEQMKPAGLLWMFSS